METMQREGYLDSRNMDEKFMKKFLKPAANVVGTVSCSALLLIWGTGKASAATVASASPGFSQCPKVGSANSCNVLITANPDGTFTKAVDSSQPGIDGGDDQLIGFQNNSPSIISSLPLTGSNLSNPIFDFDGDGICYYSSCKYTHPTIYEGPGTSFTNIASNKNSGNVNFTNGVNPSNSAYFSLEGDPALSSPKAPEALPPSVINPPNPTQPVLPSVVNPPNPTQPVPEPSSAFATLAFGILGTGWKLKRHLKKRELFNKVTQ